MRGFKVAKGFENHNIILPKRQTKSSAGYDFRACEEITIKPHKIALIPTGVKAYMQSDEVLKIYIRSSVPMKKGLILSNGVAIIDADYFENEKNDGHIMIQVMNITDNDVVVEKDERIAQGIFLKYLLTCDDDATGIRTGGFGSTK